MLYDVDYTWMIGVGILIGLPLALTFFSEEKFNISTVLIYMTIINAFLVSTGILPIWTQVLFLLIIVSLAIIELKPNSNGGI